MSAHQIRVLLAHDNLLMAEGLRHILKPEAEVVGLVDNLGELIDMAADRAPQVIVVEFALAEKAFTTFTQLKDVAPSSEIVLLNAPDDADRVAEAFEAGASGYLVKGSDGAELAFALRSVVKDGFYISPRLAREVFELGPAAPAEHSGRPGKEAIRVLIADDQFVVRQGLYALLATAGVEVVGMAEDGREAVELALRHTPEVVLMDLAMPELDGVEATRRILEEKPQIRVLIITSKQIDRQVLAAVRAGAMGYLSKEASRNEYLAALRQLCRGEPALPPQITRELIELETPGQVTKAELTRREREVVSLVAQGYENRRIAQKLFVSDVTVRTHLRNAMEKLELENRVELVLYALREGLASLDELPWV